MGTFEAKKLPSQRGIAVPFCSAEKVLQRGALATAAQARKESLLGSCNTAGGHSRTSRQASHLLGQDTLSTSRATRALSLLKCLKLTLLDPRGSKLRLQTGDFAVL